MQKKLYFLFCFCFIFAACSLNTQQKNQNLTNPAKVQNFAQASSVFKIELDDKLGQGSSLLLFIDYDKENSKYIIKVLGAFASVLLKAQYDLLSFTYDFEPEILQNKQIKELFEQTIKVLITDEYNNKYNCSKDKCTLELGSEMFKNKYIFSDYNPEGFACDVLCAYRRGIIKINLQLLKVIL